MRCCAALRAVRWNPLEHLTRLTAQYRLESSQLLFLGGAQMRQLCAGVIVAAFVVALGAPAFAATQTITGQLIDQTCYKLDKSKTGVDHKMPKGDTKDCAIGCVKGGKPVALLTSDGKLYTVTGDLAADNNAKLVPHLSH